MKTAPSTAFAAVPSPADAGLENRALWEDYRKNPHDPTLQERLLEAYLPLARRILSRMMIRLPSYLRYEDLLNSALIGLYDAITRFDPDAGTCFEAYATRRIRGAVLDELRACDPLSRRERTLLDDAEKTIHNWLAANHAPPAENQLADALNISTDELAALLDHGQPWLSLDMPCGPHGDGMLISEMLAADVKQPDEEAEAEEMRKLLRRAFRMLSEREQKILYLYYFEELRLREIALLFEITEARVCQIHSLAIAKLRQLVKHLMQNA